MTGHSPWSQREREILAAGERMAAAAGVEQAASQLGHEQTRASRQAERRQTLAQVRANSASVVDANWAFGDVRDDELLILADAIRASSNTHLHTLDLNYNPHITDAGILALVEVIPHCKLEKVVADGNAIISRSARDQLIRASLANKLAPVHANSPLTRHIDMSEMALEDHHLLLLADALRENRHVVGVVLWMNEQLTAAGMAPLLKALETSTVCHVYLDNCRAADDAGIRASLEAICAPRTLALLRANDSRLQSIFTRFVWHSTGCSDAVAEALAEALVDNTVVSRLLAEAATADQHIGVTGTPLTDVGVRHLLRVLSNGTSGLFWVRLGGLNQSMNADIIGQRQEQIVRACVENCLRRVAANDPSVTSLDLTLGMDDIVEGSLEIMDVPETHVFTTARMTRLAEALRQNTELRSLHFGDAGLARENIPDATLEALAEALPHCGVERVTIPSSGIDPSSGIAGTPHPSEQRVAELCAANKARRLAAAASLALHCPFQRLALAALATDSMYAAPESMLLLPHDLLGAAVNGPFPLSFPHEKTTI